MVYAVLYVPVHEVGKVVNRVVYAVVGYAPLGIVICAYLGGTVAGGNERLAARSDVVHVFLVLVVVDIGAQARQGAFLVLGLVARFGTFNEYLLHLAGIGVFPIVAQAHAALHLVYVLSAGTGGAEGIPTNLALVYYHVKRFGLGQYGHRGRRRMHAALRLVAL